MHTKKVGAAGRLRAGYGKKVRKKITEIEKFQRQKQKCPLCGKLKVKRTSKGIWLCQGCKKKFTSDTYFLGEK